MTVIVYRDGVIAADTRVAYGNAVYRGTIKIARCPDGTLAGAAGPSAVTQRFLDWVLQGEQAPSPEMNPGSHSEDQAHGMIVRPDGLIIIFDRLGQSSFRREYQALGSGEDAALGALFMGASAEDAVRAAIEHNAWCGGDVMSLRSIEQ